MTPEELKMKEQTDKNDMEDEEKDKAIVQKLEKEGFFARLKPYNKPVLNAVLGVIVSVI